MFFRINWFVLPLAFSFDSFVISILRILRSQLNISEVTVLFFCSLYVGREGNTLKGEIHIRLYSRQIQNRIGTRYLHQIHLQMLKHKWLIRLRLKSLYGNTWNFTVKLVCWTHSFVNNLFFRCFCHIFFLQVGIWHKHWLFATIVDWLYTTTCTTFQALTTSCRQHLSFCFPLSYPSSI